MPRGLVPGLDGICKTTVYLVEISIILTIISNRSRQNQYWITICHASFASCHQGMASQSNKHGDTAMVRALVKRSQFFHRKTKKHPIQVFAKVKKIISRGLGRVRKEIWLNTTVAMMIFTISSQQSFIVTLFGRHEVFRLVSVIRESCPIMSHSTAHISVHKNIQICTSSMIANQHASPKSEKVLSSPIKFFHTTEKRRCSVPPPCESKETTRDAEDFLFYGSSSSAVVKQKKV